MSIFRLKMKSSGKRTCFGRLGIYVHHMPGDSLTLTEHAPGMVEAIPNRKRIHPNTFQVIVVKPDRISSNCKSVYAWARGLFRVQTAVTVLRTACYRPIRTIAFFCFHPESQNSEFKEKRNFIEQKKHSENQDPNEEDARG